MNFEGNGKKKKKKIMLNPTANGERIDNIQERVPKKKKKKKKKSC